ncbi:MAG: CBS domain-containing protein [Candidatus Cloacimonetes bacterium]|jgi:CBS domain-containing protein/mannitol/fructose-specific phosphotransferase system IIA component (Ntr-type)|nr:CBS domain-containing protein [Candidatus Cloacimonadota bacterium]
MAAGTLLTEVLPREHIIVPLRATTLREALDLLVARLEETGAVRDSAALRRVMEAHRARDTVQIGSRALLPHYRTEAVDSLAMAFGVTEQPIVVNGGPTKAVRIIVLILAPPTAATLYLQTIAALARLFHDETVTERIVHATSPDDIIELAEISSLRIEPRLTVRDLMIHNADHVSMDQTVRDAVDVMVRKRVRALPVVNEQRQVVGIVSEWDVMRALLPQVPRASDEEESAAQPQQPLRVRDVMTRSVLCISEDMGLVEAANMMLNKDVEQLPVVSEGKFSGLLTRSDIIRKLFGR